MVKSGSLILASASPRRRRLLAELGVPFSVELPDVLEHEDPRMDPREMVMRNAAMKADRIASRHPDALVLGADTTVALEDWVLNKPVDLEEARSMLQRLSGRTHSVFTGVAARRSRDGWTRDVQVESRVTFKLLDPPMVEQYLARVHVLDKAGAYAIQEHGDLIVEGYSGSYSNIIGLPLESVKQILTECGLRD